MSKTVGMYGGKFVPIHVGHVYAMIQASTLVDELHVVVSYDEEYEKEVLFKDSKMKHIPYKTRLRWWNQITKDMSHVFVHAIEEKQTGQFSDWEKGADSIKQVVGKEITHVFSSEYEYGEFFSKLYSNAEHVVVDSERKNFNISATKIRTEGAVKHWNMLPEVVKPHFVKKVVVVGSESCGKSTMVKNLANLYQTNYVEEFGRTYYERLGDCVGITVPEDYPEIAFEHKYHEKKQAEKANKVLFIDTEAIVTQYYSVLYTGETQPILNEIARIQEYDLWLFLEPDVKWVDDGTRTFGEQERRLWNSSFLEQMLMQNRIKYHSISGSYEERLKKAIELVEKVLQ